MGPLSDQHKMALVSCIELVLMKRQNTKYNLIVARLNALYDSGIDDCYDHPEYLRPILKEVCGDDYNSIIDEIKLHMDELVHEKDIADFFKVMEN